MIFPIGLSRLFYINVQVKCSILKNRILKHLWAKNNSSRALILYIYTIQIGNSKFKENGKCFCCQRLLLEIPPNKRAIHIALPIDVGNPLMHHLFRVIEKLEAPARSVCGFGEVARFREKSWLESQYDRSSPHGRNEHQIIELPNSRLVPYPRGGPTNA